VAERARQLFAEFADAYARGERPDAQAFLERAGGDGDELAGLIERFLQGVPAPDAGPQDAALLALWLGTEPPLLVLRRERKLRREQLVEALRERLKLAPELRDKLNLRYHELETGQLEPAKVDRRVWDALADAMQASAAELVALARPLPVREAPVMYRVASARADSASIRQSRAEPDEVDRLFGLA
jgi:hypothetical protein